MKNGKDVLNILPQTLKEKAPSLAQAHRMTICMVLKVMDRERVNNVFSKYYQWVSEAALWCSWGQTLNSVNLQLENNWGKWRHPSCSSLLSHVVLEHRKKSSCCKYNSWAFETNRIPAHSVCVESEVPSLWEDRSWVGINHVYIWVGLGGPVVDSLLHLFHGSWQLW